MTLYQKWLDLKRQEDELHSLRMEVEAEMSEGIPEDWEGSKTWTDGAFKINAARRFSRKVDGEKIKSISEQFGLEEYLGTLFRWKPEIDTKAWKGADDTVVKLFADAITTTPGKITFKIEEAV